MNPNNSPSDDPPAVATAPDPTKRRPKPRTVARHLERHVRATANGKAGYVRAERHLANALNAGLTPGEEITLGDGRKVVVRDQFADGVMSAGGWKVVSRYKLEEVKPEKPRRGAANPGKEAVDA